MIDLVAMEEIVYLDDKGENSERRPIRAELKAEADKWHAFLLEQAAGQIDTLTEIYLETGTLSQEQVREGVRAGTLSYKFVPVLTGSALKNKGVQPMLDAVVEYLQAHSTSLASRGRTHATSPTSSRAQLRMRRRSRHSPSRSRRTHSLASSASSASTLAS